MFRFTIAVLVFIPLAANGAEPKVTANDLAWIGGSWIQKGKTSEVEEHWTSPKGGMLLGTNRTVTTAGKTFFEFLRIAETETGISYFASPMGKSATEFKLTSHEKEKAVFENPKHDFPQTITYWKAEGKLHAKIEGTVNGQTKSQSWTWDAVK